jgi:hypothetical protein
MRIHGFSGKVVVGGALLAVGRCGTLAVSFHLSFCAEEAPREGEARPQSNDLLFACGDDTAAVSLKQCGDNSLFSSCCTNSIGVLRLRWIIRESE